MFGKTILTLLTGATIALSCFAQERGNPVFSDDFENYQNSLENWKLSGAESKQSDGKIRLGSWESKFVIPANFYAEADIIFTSDKNPQGDSHAGFNCDKRNFAVTPDGYVFPAGGLPKTKIEGFKIGEPIHLTLIRKCGPNSAEYVFKVNGQDISKQNLQLPMELQEALAMQGVGTEKASKDKIDWNAMGVKMKPITIMSYGADALADNFRMSALKGGNEPQNCVINSSFEVLDSDGFPYYVFPDSWSMFELTSKELPYEKQIANWAVDDKVFHSGGHSVRMTYQKGMKYQCLWIHKDACSLMKDQPAVLSVYLKADKPDFPVTISLGNVKKEINVGTDWERYSVVNPKMPFVTSWAPMSITVKKEEGTVWADDLQIEVGTEPTPYQPSLRDKQYLSAKPEIARPADMNVPELAAGIIPSADLDSWNAKALKLDKFTVAMKPAAAKSEGWFACDKDNLYIGLRAYVDNPAAIKLISLKNDDFGVFGTPESVELMLDPVGDGKFWKFGVNAANSAVDVGRNMIVTWNGNFKHDVRFNEKTKSYDYFITMPFADFAMPGLPDQWLVNLCRNSQEKGGGMIAHWFLHKYMAPEGWPKMNLPANIIRNFKLGIDSASVTTLPEGSRIVFKLNNLSGNERKLTMSLSDPVDGRKLTEQSVLLKKGENEIGVTVKDAPSKLAVRMNDGTHLILYQEVALRKRELLSLVSRYSFYMNEDKAVFRVRTLLPEPEKMTAELECDGQKISVKGAPEFKLELPLAGIADGTHKATVTMFMNGKKVASASSDLIKRPYRENATRINRFSRSLVVDGKPYFPFSPCDVWEDNSNRKGNPEYVADYIGFWQKHGFRTLDILTEPRRGSLESKNFPVLAKAASENGMHIMLWTKFFGIKREDWNKMVPYYDQPCVITHRVEDEADITVPGNELRDFVDAMRPLFPYVPTYMNYTPFGIPSRCADLTPDILMCDPYLTNSGMGKVVDDVMSDVEAMKEPSEDMNKPMMVFLIGRNGPVHFREITSAEQIAQTYGSICIGATGLSYFIGAPSRLPHWNTFLQLNKEILSLTDVICSEEETPQAVASNAKLRTITKKSGGYLYVITCNTQGKALGNVTLSLPAEYQYVKTDPGFVDKLFGSGDADAEVLFEDRKLPVNGGKFTDEFPAHSRHVYKIRLK